MSVSCGITWRALGSGRDGTNRYIMIIFFKVLLSLPLFANRDFSGDDSNGNDNDEIIDDDFQSFSALLNSNGTSLDRAEAT